MTSGRTGRFVASLMVMAADSSGRPWDLEEPLAYRPDLVDWTKLTTPGTTVELVGGQPAGSPMPAFTPTADTLSCAVTQSRRHQQEQPARWGCTKSQLITSGDGVI